MDIGTLPGAALGADLTVGVIVGRVRLELTGDDWLSRTASTASGSEGTHIHLLEGAVRGCYRLSVRPSLEVDPCLGGGVIRASSSGFGEGQTLQRSGAWGDVRGEGLAVWSLLPQLALRASLGALVPIDPSTFVVQRTGSSSAVIPLHTPFPVAGRAGFGVEARFP